MPTYSNGIEEKSHRDLQNHVGISFPQDQPPEGWSIIVRTLSEPTVEQVLEAQKGRVRRDASNAHAEPVTDANGVSWAGGFESATKIKMATDLTEFRGRPTITLYDADDMGHDVTLQQAKEVSALIGEDYAMKLAAKKAALRALKAIDLESVDAKEQIEAITFEYYYSLQ